MSPTFASLVQRVSNDLHSFTGLHEKVVHLTAPLGESDLTMMVNDASQLNLGTVEVDDELIYISASTDGGVTIAPFGRGYMGTTAAEHTVGSKVTGDPLFPRSSILRAIKDTLRQVYPSLFAVNTTTLTASVATTYPLPADAERVFDVSYKEIGPSNYWQPVRLWDFDSFGTDRTLDIVGIPVGRDFRVTYKSKFGDPDLDSTLQDIGFPDSAEDVLIYGAAHRLVRFLDVSRLQGRSVENRARAESANPGDASRIARELYAFYTQRLAEERRRLITETQIAPHYKG